MCVCVCWIFMCPLGAHPHSVIRHLVTMQGDQGEKHSITVAWIPDSYLQELRDLHDIRRGCSHFPQDSTLGVFSDCIQLPRAGHHDSVWLFGIVFVPVKKIKRYFAFFFFYCWCHLWPWIHSKTVHDLWNKKLTCDELKHQVTSPTKQTNPPQGM